MIYPRLKGLSSPDLPAGELPAVPDDCSVLIDAEIGPSNSEGADLFSFQVVTPKWLLRDDAVLWGRGLLIVTEFSWPKVSTAVEKLLMHAARSDWSGVAQELAKELHWEFEHYSQAHNAGSDHMREGWLDREYLILFDEEETHRVTAAYGVSARLPEFLVVGLRGWDDFILQDRSGSLFTVPAVPLDHKHLKPYVLSRDAPELQTGSGRCGLIKWYVQPLVFGGDPLDQSNITWLPHETHVRAVRWWNDLYERVQNPR